MAWANYATITFRKGFCHNKLCGHTQQYVDRGLILNNSVSTCDKCGFKTIYAMPPIDPATIESIRAELQQHGLLSKPTETDND